MIFASKPGEKRVKFDENDIKMTGLILRFLMGIGAIGIAIHFGNNAQPVGTILTALLNSLQK